MPSRVQRSDTEAQGRFIRSRPYSDAFHNGVRYDYASMGAGARLVTYAKGIQHAKAILTADTSEYMLASCETRTWFVVSLLEDLFLEHIGLVSLELFASGFRHLQILGSSKYPTDEWRLLGEIESNSTASYELFDIGSRCRRQPDTCWVRFLKVRALSHHQMEANYFCALTRFQAFGSTQMTYIAEERSAEDAVDRRVEPRVADVAHWHEEATRSALADLLGDRRAVPQPPPTPARPPEPAQEVVRPAAEEPGPPAVGGDDAEGNAPALWDPLARIVDHVLPLEGTPLHEKPKAVFKLLSSWLAQGVSPPRALANADEEPRGDTEPNETEVERCRTGEPQNSGPGAPAVAEAAAAERPQSPLLTELLAELNMSGALNATGLGSLEQLSAALGSLLGSPFVAAAGPQVPSVARAAKPGSSMPALVRINNDLRLVQDGQVALQDTVKSVSSVLGYMLVLVLQVLREQQQNAQTQPVEQSSQSQAHEFSEPLPWLHPEPSESSCPGASTVGNKEGEDLVVGGRWAVWLAREARLAGGQMSLDRCVLLVLVFWNVLQCRRGTQIPATEDENGHAQAVDPPSLPTTPTATADQGARMAEKRLDSGRLTLRGATGRRLCDLVNRSGPILDAPGKCDPGNDEATKAKAKDSFKEIRDGVMPMSRETLNKLRPKELARLLKNKRLDPFGSKTELIDRLLACKSLIEDGVHEDTANCTNSEEHFHTTKAGDEQDEDWDIEGKDGRKKLDELKAGVEPSPKPLNFDGLDYRTIKPRSSAKEGLDIEDEDEQGKLEGLMAKSAPLTNRMSKTSDTHRGRKGRTRVQHTLRPVRQVGERD